MAGLDIEVGDSQRLAVLGKEISLSFDLLSRSDFEGRLQDYSPASWEHEAERFSLWANNLGLHHRGHSSLDYRLREAVALRNLISEFLADLKTSLDELKEAAVDSACLQPGSAPDVVSSENETSAKSEIEENSSDEEFASSEATAQVLLNSVIDIVDNLYRLATKIRDPASRTPSSKARLFRHADLETGVDFIEKIEPIDATHIEELLLEYRALKPADVVVPPDATLEAKDCIRKPRELDEESRMIITRLAQANTYRRQQFRHWRRHRDKIAKETLEALDRGNTVKIPRYILTGGPQLGPRTLGALSKPSTATYLRNPSRFEDDDGKSSASRRTITPKAWNARDEQIDVPPPPLALTKTAEKEKYFVCPYCFTICPKSQLQPDAWREHVLHDLRPYICTYTDCEKGDQLYDSWRDWTTHERWAHKRVWRCAIHPSETHHSALSFKEHLQKDHSTSSSEMDHEQLISVSAHLDETVTRDCLFCLCSIEDNDQLQNHIATHLQRIALFALPRSSEIEDDSEKDDASNKANAVGQGSQQLGSQEGVEHVDDIDESEKKDDVNETLLSLVNQDQGTYKASEEIDRRALEGKEKVLKEEPLDTLASMADLAFTYSNQGRYVEAETLRIEVMETRKRVLGVVHPDTLTSVAHLASIYSNQGRFVEAEKLQIEVMEARKRVLGVEHPATLASIAYLASIYSQQGQWEKAEKLQIEVMETRKRVLGVVHPDTLTSMANLAFIYNNQKRWKEAEELYVQVVEISKRVFGEEHLATIASMSDLASVYGKQGRWKEAEKLEIHVMEMRKRVFGEEHPDTLNSMANQAFTFMSQRRSEEAISLMRTCFKLRHQTLGPTHPDTEASLEALNKWEDGEHEDSEYPD